MRWAFEIFVCYCMVALATTGGVAGSDGISIELSGRTDFIYCDAPRTPEEQELCNKCPNPETAPEEDDIDLTGSSLGKFLKVGSEQFLVVNTVKYYWEDARSYCRERGLELAVPRDLFALKSVILEAGVDGWYWLGLNDRENEGTWLGYDNSPVPDGWWREWEPNDGAGGEDCAGFWVKSSDNDSKLNDWSCTRSEEYFICQR